jgi:hypothetical protein
VFPHQARVLEGLAARVVAVQETRDGGLEQMAQPTLVVAVVAVQEIPALPAALAS